LSKRDRKGQEKGGFKWKEGTRLFRPALVIRRASIGELRRSSDGKYAKKVHNGTLFEEVSAQKLPKPFVTQGDVSRVGGKGIYKKTPNQGRKHKIREIGKHIQMLALR